MLKAKTTKLIQTLMGLDDPDRRLDSLATLLLLGPPQARLDDRPGLDGWDILTGPGGEEPEVWLAADEVLYVTRFVDAAIELCDKACPRTAPLVVKRALASVVQRCASHPPATDMSGLIARHIVAETLNEGVISDVPRAA